MISVGSSDARKRLRLGFGDIGMGGGGRDADDTGLEEGEAWSNQNNEDYDGSIDPDVALSYIDVKIQDVLGHFQKDFETEVSFETLGRKFGGYGSFLSSNQRSPPWSRPKTPPKVQSYNIQRSPNNIGPECGQGNPLVSSAVQQTVRRGSSCTRSMRLSATKAPLTNNSNREVCIPTSHLDSFTSNQEPVSEKTTATSDQRLRFRIKMGQENLSTQKNAAIYTGLGLDVSPSLSNDESPFESEGISHELEDGSSESPSSILQTMTSLPVLLSPLCDDLIHLAGKGTYTRDDIVPTSGDYQETSDVSVHVSDFVKGDRKVLEGKKMKSKPRADFSVEFNGGSKKRFQNDNGVITKKELETNNLNCEDIVSKTIKLPFISNLDADTNDSSKDTDRPHDNLKEDSQRMVREKAFSDRITATHAAYSDDVEFIEKAKVVNMNNRSVKDHSVNEVTQNHRKRERSYSSMIDCKGGKVPPTESTALSGKIPTEETTKLASSLLLKVNKKPDESSNYSENDTAEVKVQKHPGKSRDRYRAVTGELEGQKYRNGLSCSLAENKPKDCEIVGRSRVADDIAKKSRNSNKKQNRPSSSDRYFKTAATVRHCLINGPVKDADPGEEVLDTGATGVAEDNWVQCDRCQKWRLLPIGKNPDELPDKWLCSMLDWLPGLNNCNINEEETQKGAVSLFQVPLPESQNNHPGGAVSTIKNHGQHATDPKLQAIPSGKKKLWGEVSNGANKDSSGSNKKNLQASIRRGSSNGVNKSSLDSVSVEQKSIMSSGITGEARRKLKRRLDSDQNVIAVKKKSKTEKMKTSYENQISDYNGARLEVHPNSSNNFQITSPRKGQLKKEEWPSSKDLIHNTKERRQVTVKKQRDRNQGSLNEGSMDMGHSNSKDSSKKRDLKEYQDTPTYMGSVQNKVQQEQEMGVSLQEGISGNNCRREKKARSESENKESGTIKGHAITDKKESHVNKELRKVMGNVHLPQALDSMDCVKRDSGSLQDPAAANSSSSKMSASHRSKASFREIKGSPGDSVSSSPMRKSNIDGPHFRKLGKGSSSQLNDRNSNFQPEYNADRVKSSEQLRDRSPSYEAKQSDGRTRSQDIFDVKSGRIEIKSDSRIDSLGKLSNEGKRSPIIFLSEKSEHVDQVSRRGKSGMIENETLPCCPRPVSSSRKVNGDIGNGDSKVVNESKLQKKQIRKVDHQQISSRHQASSEHRTKELDTPCPSRRNSSTHSANNALKEATDLKHLADRLKNAGSSESTGLYFQAALKFLHGASLLESCNNGNAKHNELTQSKQLYSSTAKLCGFCAHEYEKAKDMETAALAYKCMEVAYMRVIYSSHTSASRDRHELQTALKVVHLGESPSSSASDVDNVHNAVMAEKLALPKGISSPQISGAQIVAARNRSSVTRLLNFTQDVNSAMEASRKSQNAFATVNAISSETKNAEGIPAIKEALDFSFQDVEGLLRLVRLAMESINR